jgi:hypothetical protein
VGRRSATTEHACPPWYDENHRRAYPGLPAKCDPRRPGRGRPLSVARDRAVGGVACGGAEVGRRVGAGAAAEAVGARLAGEPVVANGAARAVVAPPQDTVSLPCRRTAGRSLPRQRQGPQTVTAVERCDRCRSLLGARRGARARRAERGSGPRLWAQLDCRATGCSAGTCLVGSAYGGVALSSTVVRMRCRASTRPVGA